MFEIDKIASEVIGNSGGAYVSRLFRLDDVNYSWVKDYKRDQKIRAEIEDLRKNILDTAKLPIHKDELKARFESLVKQVNDFRIKQITELLSRFQKREAGAYSEYAIGGIKILDAPYLPYFMKFSPSDIEAIFSKLSEGVRQMEIDKTIEKYQKQIKELEAVIAQELSPQSRWLYQDNGKPIPYPRGCRWHAFAEVWKKVQARFDGQVNINGSALKTEAECMAHTVLEVNNVARSFNLRKPILEFGRDLQ